MGDISDTDSSEAVDRDDDDYDSYANSGSGDFNNQLVEQPNQDWVAPTIEKIRAKKLNKQEQIINSYSDNTYGINDSSKEVDTDAIDFVDNADEVISKKIAKAHKKQSAMQSNANIENQKPKSKQNFEPNTSNKRKSKEQRYIDEYFSGVKTENSADGNDAESQLVKNGWMEPRIRRILGNMKKSEERSQQILLCKVEGELCSMLFKTPIKPIATP